MSKDYVGEFLIVALLLSSMTVSYMIKETGDSAVCRGGVWNLIGEPNQYQCSVNERIETCHHLSSTSKTCYLGIIIEETSEEGNSCGDYFCYKEKDYCRKDGLLTNPKVLRSDVCN